MKIEVKNIFGINNFAFPLPDKKGVYALVGENGTYKSTLMHILSGLLASKNLNNLLKLKSENIDISNINYIDNDCSVKFKWAQNSRWAMNTTNTSWSDFKYEGYYEQALLGHRISRTSKAIKVPKPTNLEDEDDFIKDAMNTILNTKTFEHLYIQKKSRYEIFRFLKINDSTTISEFNFSTGMFLLLNLIIQLHKLSKKTNEKKSLILIDEVEMALHPLAQMKLVDYLKKFSKKYNAIVIMATHSVNVINNIHHDNIFFLERQGDDICLINPCYPSYASKMLYVNDSYDHVILVEDIMARYYIQHVISKNNLLQSSSYIIVPAGGDTQVISFSKFARDRKIFGTNAKYKIILDGDMKQKHTSASTGFPLDFLPVDSIEKYFYANLYQSGEDINKIKTMLQSKFNYTYQAPTETNMNNKSFMSYLRREIKNATPEMTIELIDNGMSEYIYDNFHKNDVASNMNSLIET